MSDFECRNCDLGLTFSSKDELKNHQTKFCTNYNDVSKLDARLSGLKRVDPSDVKYGMADIKDYLKGKSDLKQPLSFDEKQQLSYNSKYIPISTSNQKAPLNQNSNIYSSNLENQAINYKENKQIVNIYKNQTEQDMVSLLGDLQRKKDIELRAQIEKEEIAQAIRTTNRSQLESMGKQKNFELEKLAKERESVQIRESNMLEQIQKLESDLINKESQNMRLNDQKLQMNVDAENRRVRKNDTMQKEIEFAEDRASQVAKIKIERERLEQDRQRIQTQLKVIQQRQQNEPKNGFRENTAAKRTGSAVTNQNLANSKSYQRLEPSLKDKLVDDQMRINYLREEQQKSKAILNDPDSLEEDDILQRELGKQQNYYQGLQKLTDEYADKNYPKKDEMLGDIRRSLERESAAPQSVRQKQFPQKLEGGQSETPQKNSFSMKKQQQHLEQNKNIESNLFSKLDDLENLLIKKQQQNISNSQKPPKPQKGQLYNSMQQAPLFPPVFPQQQSQNYTPTQNFMQPQWQQNQPIQPQDMKQYYPQYQNPYYQQQQQFQPPQMYHPPPQQPDPSLAYFAQFLQSQEEENRKLRDALQNLGKNTNTVDEINNSINNATMEIQKIKNDPPASVNGPPNQTFNGQKPYNDNSLPDEFIFHQNELRCKDLEIEERALMNLQAQEYDQLLILQKLPKDSELYEYKLKQYKELSALRAEAEKVLQEQRIDKIKYDYEIQKAEQARNLLHQQWLEQQKRQILEGRIGGVNQQSASAEEYQNQFPPQQNYPTVSDVTDDIYENKTTKDKIQTNTKKQEQKKKVIKKNDTIDEVVVQYDFIYNLPKNIQKIKIVSIPFQSDQQLDEPQDIGPTLCDPALDDKSLNQVFFQTQKSYSNIPLGDSRIVFEIQAFNPTTNLELFSIGWTWIDLQGLSSSKLRTGKWSLPIYTGPTNPQIAAKGGEKPNVFQGVTFGVRIGVPDDQVFNSQTNPRVDLNESPVPREHSAAASQILPLQQNSPLKKMNTSVKKPESGYDSSYNNQGVKIRVHYCQTKKDYSKVTVRCTLQTQEDETIIQNDGQGCQYKNASAENVKLVPMQIGQVVGVDQYSNVVSVQNKNQISKMKQMSFGPICKINGFMRPFDHFEFVWNKDLHKYFWDNQGLKNIFLLIELFGKPSKNEERRCLGYSIIEILTKKDGKLKTGFFDIQLNNPPITFDYNQQVEIEGEHIGITLMDPFQVNVNKASMVEDNEMANDSPRPDTGTLSEQFHPNFDKQYTFSDGWTNNDSLDLYIDGTRHLPDNSTVTKITIKILDFNLKEQVKQKQNLAILDQSTLRNQTYLMKFELRAKEKLMPTSLAYIIIETIDKSSLESRFLGFSYFPLFMDSRDQMPAATDNVQLQNLVPHTGLFQMPIFSTKPNEQIPFTYEKFVYLERVPTASILIRAVKAQKDQSGKPIVSSNLPADQQYNFFVQPPVYSEGLYSTQYYTMTEEEKKIMMVRRKRPNPKLEKVSDDLIRALKKNPDLMQGAQKLEFLYNSIKCEKQTLMLDYNYFSQYDSGLGIRINIEALHNNKTKGFPLVMASVIPPASYYDSDRKLQRFRPKDSFLFIDHDLDSHYQTPKFNEGDALLIGFEPQQPGMSLLLDIKMYMPDQNKIVDYGFGLCPLIDTVSKNDENQNKNYVISGLFSIPVYKGVVNRNFVNQLKNQTQPLQYMKQSQNKKEITLLNETSIIVRVVDTQRKMQFLKSFEKYQNNVSTRYLDQSLLKSHKYEEITGGFFGAPAKLKEILPKDWKNSSNIQGFNQILENMFKDFMNV